MEEQTYDEQPQGAPSAQQPLPGQQNRLTAADLVPAWPRLREHLTRVPGDFTHLARGILNDDIALAQYNPIMATLEGVVEVLEADSAELRRQLDAALPQGGIAKLASLQTQTNQLGDEITRLQSQLHKAEVERDLAQNSFDQGAAGISSAPTNGGPTPSGSAKMNAGTVPAPTPLRPLGNDPPVFIGDHTDHLVRQEEYTNWQLLCRMKLATDEAFYPTPARQIVYAAGRLQGKALTLVAKRVTAVMKDERDPSVWDKVQWVGGWTGLESLFSTLDSFFITTDIAASYRRLFATLKQGSTHFSDFLATFNRYTDGFEAPDIQKVDGLRNKVCDALKDAIMTKTDRPAEDAYDDWVKLYRQLWNNIEERRASKATQAQSQPPRNQGPRDAPPAQTSSEPMDLSRVGTPRGPLSQEERDRRYSQGLCLYCGSDRHLLATCDRKPRDKPAPRSPGNA